MEEEDQTKSTRGDKSLFKVKCLAAAIIFTIFAGFVGAYWYSERLKSLQRQSYYGGRVVHKSPLWNKTRHSYVHPIFDFLSQTELCCQHQTTFGGNTQVQVSGNIVDGAENVCLDQLFTTTKPCIVYSLGNQSEGSFEDQVANFGCVVYLFESAPKTNTKSLTNPRVHYVTSKMYERKMLVAESYWSSTFLEEMLEYLNHSSPEVKIQYLKIDWKGKEFAFLEDIIKNRPELLNKFEQINLAIYLGKYSVANNKEFDQYLNFLKQFANLGLSLFDVSSPDKVGIRYIHLKSTLSKEYKLLWLNNNLNRTVS